MRFLKAPCSVLVGSLGAWPTDLRARSCSESCVQTLCPWRSHHTLHCVLSNLTDVDCTRAPSVRAGVTPQPLGRGRIPAGSRGARWGAGWPAGMPALTANRRPGCPSFWLVKPAGESFNDVGNNLATWRDDQWRASGPSGQWQAVRTRVIFSPWSVAVTVMYRQSKNF